MNRRIWTRIFAWMLAPIAAAVSVQSAETPFSGMVKLFSSVFIEDNPAGEHFSHRAGEFGLRRVEVRFTLAGDVSQGVSYALRLDGFAAIGAMSLSGNTGLLPEAESSGAPLRSEPFDLLLTEASVKVSGFIHKNLDLTVGKQRIFWGTADGLNVVDNLNPVDLANFFTFDPDYFAEKRPQTAVNMEFHLGPASRLQFVWLLEHQVSPLPRGFSSLLAGDDASRIHVASPEPILGRPSFGLRLSAVLGKTDVGLTYYRGNFHLPVLTGWSLSAGGLDLRFDYPRQQVFGLDLAGEALGLGLWGEAAYVVPDNVRGSVSLPQTVDGGLVDYVSTFRVFERGWLRWVLGADTTLSWGSGLYLNVQYLRGFFDESAYSALAGRAFMREKGMFFGLLGDYFLGRAEYKLLRGDLRVETNVLLEMTGSAAAWVFMPGLEFRASDAFSLRAGTFWTAGSEAGTKFGAFRKDKLVYLAFKANF